MSHLVRFDDALQFVPAGHSGVLNRMLAGESEGDVAEVSIWHGDFEPGGESELHVHPDSAQIYVVLSGELVAGDATSSRTMRAHDTFVIPAGEEHFIANRGTEKGSVLVVSSPPLR